MIPIGRQARIAVRDEIRHAFVPVVRAAGFDVLPHRHRLFMDFRRDAGSLVHVLEVQWEKYGRPRFVINYGTCPASGLDAGGRHFDPADVCAGWLPDSGRLQPKRGATSASWFRQDHPLWKQILLRGRQRAAPDVVAQAIRLLSELETYWDSRQLGAHMHAVPPAADV